MELLPGFEPGTSSLPKISRPFFGLFFLVGSRFCMTPQTLEKQGVLPI